MDNQNSSNKGNEVMVLLRDVMSLFRQGMSKNFLNTGFTAPQGMVMGNLMRFVKMKISELSERLSLSNSTVSGIIDRLESQGIVERIRSEEDRRIVYVTMTEKFNEHHKSFHKASEEGLGKIISKGTNEEINKVIEGLNILKKLLEDKEN